MVLSQNLSEPPMTPMSKFSRDNVATETDYVGKTQIISFEKDAFDGQSLLEV